MSVMAYVARRPCGHPVALLVDDGTDTKDLGKELAKLVADGRTIERVTIEEARKIGVVYCACVNTKEEDVNRKRIATRSKRSPRFS